MVDAASVVALIWCARCSGWQNIHAERMSASSPSASLIGEKRRGNLQRIP